MSETSPYHSNSLRQQRLLWAEYGLSLRGTPRIERPFARASLEGFRVHKATRPSSPPRYGSISWSSAYPASRADHSCPPELALEFESFSPARHRTHHTYSASPPSRPEQPWRSHRETPP